MKIDETIYSYPLSESESAQQLSDLVLNDNINVPEISFR